MNFKKLLTTLCLLLGVTFFTQAQLTTDQMVKEWERAKAYTKEYLDAMPDASYSLKPTPAMRSFAEQMLHLSDANNMFASTALGEKNPAGGQLEKTVTDKSKANITKLTMDSYDYVIASLKKLPAAQYNDKVKLFGQLELTKIDVFVKDFEHQTHHRGQTTVYLRLAGVTPPQEKLF